MIYRRLTSIRLLVGFLALVGGAIRPATAQHQAERSSSAAVTGNPQPAQAVGTEQAQYLVRAALLTLNDANRSGNYTVLRDLAAPGFQVNNTAADLAQNFADLRRRNFDLFAAAILAPQFSTPPKLDAGGKLHLMGFFPTRPLQINFDLIFQSVGGQWRLFAISVATPEAAPHALLQLPMQDSKPKRGFLAHTWLRPLARPAALTVGKTF